MSNLSASCVSPRSSIALSTTHLSCRFWLENADHWSCPMSPRVLFTKLFSIQLHCLNFVNFPKFRCKNQRVWLWSATGWWKDQALPERRRVDVQRDCNLPRRSTAHIKAKGEAPKVFQSSRALSGKKVYLQNKHTFCTVNKKLWSLNILTPSKKGFCCFSIFQGFKSPLLCTAGILDAVKSERIMHEAHLENSAMMVMTQSSQSPNRKVSIQKLQG